MSDDELHGAAETAHEEATEHHEPEHHDTPEAHHAEGAPHCEVCHGIGETLHSMSEQVSAIAPPAGEEGDPTPEAKEPHDKEEIQDKSPHGVPWTHRGLF